MPTASVSLRFATIFYSHVGKSETCEKSANPTFPDLPSPSTPENQGIIYSIAFKLFFTGLRQDTQ